MVAPRAALWDHHSVAPMADTLEPNWAAMLASHLAVQKAASWGGTKVVSLGTPRVALKAALWAATTVGKKVGALAVRMADRSAVNLVAMMARRLAEQKAEQKAVRRAVQWAATMVLTKAGPMAVWMVDY